MGAGSNSQAMMPTQFMGQQMQPVDFVPMAGTCQYAGTRRTGVFSLQAMISTQFTEQQMWPINVVPTTGTSENSQYAGTRRAPIRTVRKLCQLNLRSNTHNLLLWLRFYDEHRRKCTVQGHVRHFEGRVFRMAAKSILADCFS